MNSLKALANSIKDIITGIKRNTASINYELENMRGYKTDPKLVEKSKAQNGRYKNLVGRRIERYNKVHSLFINMFEILNLDLDKSFLIADLTEEEISTLKPYSKKKAQDLCDKKLAYYQKSTKETISQSFTDEEWAMVIAMRREFEELLGDHKCVQINVKAKSTKMFVE